MLFEDIFAVDISTVSALRVLLLQQSALQNDNLLTYLLTYWLLTGLDVEQLHRWRPTRYL